MITIGSAFLLIVLILYANSFSDLLNLPVKYFYYSLAISFMSIYYHVILAQLYVEEKAQKISITSIILGVMGIIIQLVMVIGMNDKAMALIGSMLVNAIISFVIFIWYSFPYFCRPKLNYKQISEYLKYGFSQWPSDVCVWLIHASDRILLNKYQGTHDTGIYGMGSNFAQIPTVLLQSVNKAYSPYTFTVFKKKERGEIADYSDIAKSTGLIISAIACLVALLSMFSNNIVLLLSERFSETSYIIPLVLIASFVDCARLLFMYPMAYKVEYVKIKSLIWILSASLSLCLNIWLIPHFSMYGACIASISSYFLSLLAILYFSNKAIHIPYYFGRIIKVVIISIVVGLAFLLGTSMYALIIKIIIAFLYFYIILIINSIKVQDLYGKVFCFK